MTMRTKAKTSAPRMGRKPKPEGERLDPVALRLAANTLARLGTLAERQGIGRTVLARLCLLDGLDRLKAALLTGRVLPSELERLRTTLALRRETTDDPRLDEVLGHIELRAAVELAKLKR